MLNLMVPKTPWLPREHHADVVEALVRLGLIKFDNGRNLPLTNGGTTDIYLDLRGVRRKPAAIRLLTDLFATPMRWLKDNGGIVRFLEVPDGITPVASPLSLTLGLPYTTVRDVPKAGRAEFIGELNFGEPVAILDDVITDGKSKIPAVKLCSRHGARLLALVVLCDRQQGWEDVFSENGVFAPVWPGFTLHDVRRELINLGVMQRCDPKIEAENPVIVALDGKSWEGYLPLLERLRPTGCILKVNDLLIGEGAKRLLPELEVYGRIMADLKSHDIPNTVENICQRLRSCSPWAVTVHASGGGEMVEAACSALHGVETNLLAVTVLTSIDNNCEEIYSRQPLEQVMVLAEIAWQKGATGFVCSPEEVGNLRKRYPEALLVVPGIRSAGSALGDQKRVGTPADTIFAGADHIVMGKEITLDHDPVARLAQIRSTLPAPVVSFAS